MSKPANSSDRLADDLCGPGEVALAEYIGESVYRIRYLIRTRSLPVFKIGGRWYARKSELRAAFSAEKAA